MVFLELNRRFAEIGYNVNVVVEFLLHKLEPKTGLAPIPLEVFRFPGDGTAYSRLVRAADYFTCYPECVAAALI